MMVNEMILEVGKFYKTRQGNKVEILKVDNFQDGDKDSVIGLLYNSPLIFRKNGTHSYGYNYDIVSEWKEVVKHTKWINIYKQSGEFSAGYIYNSESDAKEKAEDVNFIACVKIQFDEE